jgi:hypothetical protein
MTAEIFETDYKKKPCLLRLRSRVFITLVHDIMDDAPLRRGQQLFMKNGI